MSVIDSDEEIDYTVEDIENICRREDEINLEDLLSTGRDDKEVFTSEKEINNITCEINYNNAYQKEIIFIKGEMRNYE